VKPSRDLERLIEIMAALRTPGTGCAWDLEQDFASIAPYTIEEAYEVADAISRGDFVDLRDELGDLLLQVVFHARMAEERGLFAFPEVVEAITTKLIRRHPHVFGEARNLDPVRIKALWGEIKAQEKADRASERAAAGFSDPPAGVLDGVPVAQPSLMRADKLTRKAATVGFDWPTTPEVLDKVREELAEVEEAIASGDRAAMGEEIGDLLFSLANLARHLDIDPEAALAATNAKFERRFRAVEEGLREVGKRPQDVTLAEMDDHWVRAKRREKTG
jgi:ATP diphosphatase